ncbi:MAG: preprotein translocase subunit SecE [Clostridiales bacterium]|nr:preprotein translocase subunit SecE [Clostridiales bacterium]
MSKKQKVVEAQQETAVDQKKDQVSKGVVAKDEKKKDKSKKKDKKKGGLVKKTKETVSELKKVTWPTFGEVLKKTGIVIAFVLIFGLFIYGVNALLGYLTGLLV